MSLISNLSRRVLIDTCSKVSFQNTDAVNSFAARGIHSPRSGTQGSHFLIKPDTPRSSEPILKYDLLNRNYRIYRTTVTEGRFYVDFGGCDFGYVEYELFGYVYNLHYTFIPECIRGRGYGYILGRTVFDHIVYHRRKMIITCHFLRRVYEKHCTIYRSYVVEV